MTRITQMNADMNDIKVVVIYADGRTEPNIESGTPIIIVQDGEVSAGKFVLEADEYGDFNIAHPTNDSYINSLAAEYIEKKNSTNLCKIDFLTILCPVYIAEQMQW